MVVTEDSEAVKVNQALEEKMSYNGILIQLQDVYRTSIHRLDETTTDSSIAFQAFCTAVLKCVPLGPHSGFRPHQEA